MGASTDWQYLISSSWRIFFICMVTACQALWINQKFLPLRHSPVFYLLFFFIRTIILYVGFQVFLAYFYENSNWYLTVFNSVAMLFVIVMYFLLYYIFDGEFLKVFISSHLTEIVSVFPSNLALAFVNYLSGRQESLYLYGEFHLYDLLFPVLLFSFTWLIGRIAFPYIKRFRNWKIKHRKLVWTVSLMYAFCAFSTYLVEKENLLWGCLLILSIYIVVVTGLTIILRNNQNKIRKERNYYHTRQRLIESYLPDILTQLEQMEHCRKIIDAQMEEIIQLENTQKNNEKIRSYLSEIQQAYNHIKAGIFCDNWLIDSALCFEQKIMDKEGIRFSFQLQCNQAELIPDEDMVQLLLLFLDWGIENVRRFPNAEIKYIRLQINSIKNHLLVQLETFGDRKLKLRKNTIRQYLKKYSGNIQQEQMNGYIRTVIDLQYNLATQKRQEAAA